MCAERPAGDASFVKMHIRVRDPQLVPELVQSLLDADCVAEVVDDLTCRVAFRDATDDRQIAVELGFFVRAWARRNGNAQAVLIA